MGIDKRNSVMSSEVETSRSLAESEIPPFGRNDPLIMSTYLDEFVNNLG